jgi:photosystem II stability/assembly factor-like uncharacterized protein
MKKIYFLVVCYFTCIISINAQWTVKNLPLVSNEDLYGISFINDTTANICSNTRITYCTNNFNNFTTNNVVASIGASTVAILCNQIRDIYFTNSTNGFITGQFNILNDYDVFGTTDGGNTWTINYTYNSGGLPRYFMGFDFNGSEAVTCGSLGRIIKSNNFGTTWSNIISGTSNTLNDITYISPTNILCVGENVMLRSSNAGNNWSIDNTYNTKNLKNISLTNSNNTIYTCSDNEIYKSNNGGLSFTTQSTPFININCIKAKSADTLFIGTSTGIYMSYNSGTTWEQFKSTKNYFVNKIEINGGKIYALCKSTKLLISDLSNLNPEPYANFNLNQIVTCDSTFLQTQNASSTFYTNQWQINSVNYSTLPNFNKTYTVSPGSALQITLIVSNGTTTDTLTKTIGITIKTKSIANIGPDKYDCYGQSISLSNISSPAGQTYDWTPHNLISGIYTSQNATTIPLTGNIQLILSTNNSDNCPSKDTINIYSTAQIQEAFHKTNPYTTDQCQNASCVAITSLDFVSPLIGFGIAQSGELIKTIDGATTWTTTQIGASTTNADKRGIEFIDANIGYISGMGKKTIDGGNTFTSFGLGGIGSTIHFLNKDTGIISTQGVTFYENQSKLYLTLNGASTFTTVYNYATHGTIFIQDVKIVNTNVMIIAGSTTDYNYPPLIKRTLDGGATWTNLNVPGNICIHEIAVFGQDTIFAINGLNNIYKTVNGGVTWSTYKLNNTFSQLVTSIKMLNSQVGYAGANTGGLYKTTNGGDCWQEVFNTSGYTNIYSIAVPPEKNAVFFSGEVSLSSIKPQVFATQYYKKLMVSIDSNWCAENVIHTHNLSTGYTSYKWFLNNSLYSTRRDTVFYFNNTGTHVVRFEADSANTGLVTQTYTLNITPSLGSVGPIYGPTGVCTNYSLFPQSPQFSAPTNTSITMYNWSTDSPSLIGNGLTDNDSVVNPYFMGNVNNSFPVKIFVFGKDAKGCLTTDTSQILVRTRHNILNLLPTVFNVNTHCFEFDTLYDYVLYAHDTINCSTLQGGASVDYYQWESVGQGFYTSSVPNFNLPIYGDCPSEQHQIKLYYANACGYGGNNGLNNYYYSAYPNYTFTAINDTIVNIGSSLTLQSSISFGNDIDNDCANIMYSWYLNGNFISTDWYGDLYINNVTALDTGLYTVYVRNGCDSVFKNVKVTFPIVTSLTSINDLIGINLFPNPTNGILIIENSNHYNLEFEVYNTLGEVISSGIIPGEKKQIDLSSFSNGYYSIKLKNKETQQFIVQKINLIK